VNETGVFFIKKTKTYILITYLTLLIRTQFFI